MSKSLKKLIDINRLREFKNKLVEIGSAYVQTGAVDQTVAGTKTFSKPIVGSVTGSSGSCTGNAATATQFSANATVALTGDATGTSAGSKKGWSVPVTLANSGVTAGTYGPSADVTGNNNATISVPEITVDAKGRVTSVTNRTLTCKNNTYTVNNATLTIQKNGTNVATFTSNASSNATANITVPTKTSELTNDSGFLTSHQSLSNYVTLNGTQTISGNKTFTGTLTGTLTGNCSGTSGGLLTNTTFANRSFTYTEGSVAIGTTAGKAFKGSSNNAALVSFPENGTVSTDTSANIQNLRLTWRSDGKYLHDLFTSPNSRYFWHRDVSNASARPWRRIVEENTTDVTPPTWNISIGGNAATATKLATARTIALSGAATGTATGFDGSGNITIPVTSLDASKLTGTASVSTTGNAATATKLATARSLWGNKFDGSAAITGIITETPGIEFMTAATSNIGGYLDFHYNHSTADYTSRIIESASGTLSINNVTITTGKVVTAATFNGALKGNVTGNCSGSSGSCTGNAATATKLAAKRTIALSGAATGTATAFDGSGNITIPVTALASSAIRAQWYAAYPDGPEAHNAMWGGRDITAAFDSGEFSEHIADGTFRDIFPGDYITKQVTISGKTYTVNWVIADCDYWWHKGDQNNGMETHHVVIVPQVPIFNANMNATNTAEGGYAGSEMYKNVIPACATGIVNAFGSSHILTFRDGITNSVDTSVSSGIPQLIGTPGWWGVWVSAQCNLMSEKMVYGAPVCSAGAMDNTMATRQMSAFRLSEKLISYNRKWWWLRDVVSSAYFALVAGNGSANAGPASYSDGVRPFALLK